MKKVVVIGAGILGASAAYHLTKHGAEVIVIDRDDDGQATNAAAGIISPWLARRQNKAWYRLAKNGAHMYPELISELNKDGEKETGYKRVGLIGLYTDKEKLLAAEKRILERRKDAPEIGNISLLNSDETKQFFPLVGDNYQSIHISGAARVDGRALRNAMLRAAKKHGATIIKGNAKLVREGNQISGVTVRDEQIKADTVIAASGAWMVELLKPLGIEIDVVPQKAQIIHLQLHHRTDNSMWPIIRPPNNQYMLPFNDNRIVIGATHESKAGFDYRVTAGGVQEILTKALDIAPELADSTILETKVGFRPFTPGSLPIIGSLPNINGLILANGLGASGLTTGPYIGLELAKLALGEKLDIDLNDYSVVGAIK